MKLPYWIDQDGKAHGIAANELLAVAPEIFAIVYGHMDRADLAHLGDDAVVEVRMAQPGRPIDTLDLPDACP